MEALKNTACELKFTSGSKIFFVKIPWWSDILLKDLLAKNSVTRVVGKDTY